MKATIQANLLHDALVKSQAVIYKGSLPLNNVKMNFTDSNAKLSATNLECAVEIDIDGTSLEPFSILLPKKPTTLFLGKSKDSVGIELQGKSITISIKDMGEFTLKDLPLAKDFPLIPPPEPDLTWKELDAKWFLGMLAILTNYAAENESRPILTGICLEDGRMASADGFRLAVVTSPKLDLGLSSKLAPAAEGTIVKNRAIIPATAAHIMTRIFAKIETLKVAANQQRIYFKSDDTLLTSQLIQGNFPNYDQLIPQSFNYKFSFSSPIMLQRLNMIDYNQLVGNIIRIKTENNVCELSGGMEDTAIYKLNLPVKSYADGESHIAVNIKYLADVCKPFSVCNMELKNPSDPMKFTGDIEELVVAVMPMFVQW